MSDDLGTSRRRMPIVAMVGLASTAAAVGSFASYRARTEWNAHHGASIVLLASGLVAAACATLSAAEFTRAQRERRVGRLAAFLLGMMGGVAAGPYATWRARPTLSIGMDAVRAGDTVRAERAGYGLLRDTATRRDGEMVLDEIRLRRLGTDPPLAEVVHALSRFWRRDESRARLREMLRRAVGRELDAAARGQRSADALDDLAETVGAWLPAERDRLAGEAALAQFAECSESHDVFCAARLSERARSGGVPEARIAAARAHVVESAQQYLRRQWADLTAAGAPDRRASVCPGLRSEAIALMDVFGLDPSVPIRDIDAFCGVYGRSRD